MRRLWIAFTLTVSLLCLGVGAGAQDIVREDENVIPEGYERLDTVVVMAAATVDSSLVGSNIFLLLPSTDQGGAANVKVHQSQAIRDAMDRHFEENTTRALHGYRVRIFFDNKQTARTNSEEAMKTFNEMFPDVVAYRSYTNPYFKVTVGDFRTRSEAMQLLRRIREAFPSAFIVKENINYPVVDKQHPVTVDTLSILRPIRPTETIL